MNVLKKLLLILGLLPLLVFASEGGFPLDRAPNRSNDLPALQHGAKLFVNYCLNCHSASAMRYSRLKDLGLTEDQIKNNLLFTSTKVGDMMTVAMQPADSAAWFGKTPPDLSVIARARASSAGSGSDWLYTYLRTFYVDDTRPTGWNNMVFPSVGMPHVLWELQGRQAAVFKAEKDPHDPSKTVQHFEKFEQLVPGSLSTSEYDNTVADLVGYLAWMAEPVQYQRKRLGVWVVLYLALFSLIVWRLNASYWKEVK